jgi:hypothetical protein
MQARGLWLFLYSTSNIVGSFLGLIGLLLFFTGVVKSYWPFIVMGLYGIGYFGTPRSEKLELAMRQDMDYANLKEQLDSLLRSVKKRLSQPVMERLESIKETLITLLPYLREMQRSDHQLHIIKSTATRYLPEMLEKYLALPPAFARFHSLKSGKTPREELLEQLAILDNELKQILEDIHEKKTDDLAAHGRFLRDKFASGKEWLD